MKWHRWKALRSEKRLSNQNLLSKSSASPCIDIAVTSSSHRTLKMFRQLHLYIGVFTAPALLFFAFTGALQTFSLHETTGGSSYTPPRWAVVLGQIHKKQTPVVAAKKPPKPAAVAKLDAPASQGAHEAEAAPPAVRQHHPLPLKIFFLIVAIGLALSTITGIYMSYKYTREKSLTTVLLVLGILIPLALVFV